MIDSIKNILRDEYWTISQNEMQLTDNNSGMKVDISQIPENGLLIRMPVQRRVHMEAILLEKKGYTRRCDYLLMSPDKNNIVHIYFIEMKETLHLDDNDIPVRACKQLLCTIPIWDYLNSMVRIHFRSNRPTIKKHFCVIAEKVHKSIDKQSVKGLKPRKCYYEGKPFTIICSTEKIPFQALNRH